MSNIIGMDGCSAGWFTTKIADKQSLIFNIIEDLNDDYLKKSNLSHIGIDIPLYLSKTGKRRAEIEARFLLKKRACTIFSPPTFNVLRAKNYIDACEINFKECGNRISKQSWNLFPKIKEAQKFLENNLICQVGIFEVHPELSFMAMNDMKVIEFGKKTNDGFKMRYLLLKKFFPKFNFEEVRAKFKKKDVADDDILDAVAVLWSTQKIIDKIVSFVPKDPETPLSKIYY